MSDSPNILYIDDEEDLVMLASSFFEDENMPLETCTTFAEAMAKIRTKSYDLIISDSRMPTGSGKELFLKIKSENLFSGKFILVTGNIDSQEESEQNHYDLVLYKPLRFQELVDHVKRLLTKL